MTIDQLGILPNWQSFNEHLNPPLNNNELHLWWLQLNLDDKQKEFTHSLLSDKQLDKYNRRSTPQLKDAYLAGRYYLFTLLSRYSNCKPNDIRLSYNRLNKPFLTTTKDASQDTQIKFNFTDTTIRNKTYALYAFCRDKEVGVDLEARSRSNNLRRIAQRRFTEQELRYVTDGNGQINPQRSLAIWTRKEAFGKAVGVGINFPMNQRNLVGEKPHEYNFTDNERDWRLLQIQPNSTLIGSVVHESHQKLSIKAFSSLNQEP